MYSTYLRDKSEKEQLLEAKQLIDRHMQKDQTSQLSFVIDIAHTPFITEEFLDLIPHAKKVRDYTITLNYGEWLWLKQCIDSLLLVIDELEQTRDIDLPDEIVAVVQSFIYKKPGYNRKKICELTRDHEEWLDRTCPY
jgi:hypothetical protein